MYNLHMGVQCVILFWAVLLLFAGCATRPAPVITKSAQITPVNSVRHAAATAQNSLISALEKIKSENLQSLNTVRNDIEKAQAAVSDLQRGLVIILNENEHLKKEKAVFIKENQALTAGKASAEKKLSSVLAQRNLLAGFVIFIVLTFAGLFLGPKLLKLTLRIIKI